MQLEAAHDLVHRDPDAASALIEQLTDQTEAGIAEIRRLVDGLRPPALDQLGLVSALRQRADQHNHAVRLGSSGPVLTVVAEVLTDLPAAVEVAAYRIAVEAVNNAVRHGHASRCVVTLTQVEGGGLQVEICDDGTGLVAAQCRRRGGRGLDAGSGRGAGWHVQRGDGAHGRHSGRGLPADVRPRGQGGTGVTSEPQRVLVVDDHDDFRRGLEALIGSTPSLELAGTASDGLEAVRIAMEVQPDVVLMDVHMPRLNGIEATEQIVASSPHIGVLVLTMLEDDDSVFAAVRAGARGYLLKGARRAEIIRSIEAVGAGEVIFGRRSRSG